MLAYRLYLRSLWDEDRLIKRLGLERRNSESIFSGVTSRFKKKARFAKLNEQEEKAT